MKIKRFFISALAISTLSTSLTACSNTTASNTRREVGAGIGAVGGYLSAAYMKASNAVKILLAAGGAALGYEIAGLEPAQKPIKLAGGTVYQVGDYVTIVIPSDVLFQPGKAVLTLQANKYFSAAATIIKKYPTENILVTANEAGLFSKKDDLRLSTLQAEKAAAGLFGNGINSNNAMRSIHYTGLGDKHFVADSNYGAGITANRRIQITLYPSKNTDRKEGKQFNIKAY